MHVLRTQNSKIQDLYEDLERKDNIISSLQNQLKSIDAYKSQIENYKKQILILEEKLKLSEIDTNSKKSHLSDQLKNVLSMD